MNFADVRDPSTPIFPINFVGILIVCNNQSKSLRSKGSIGGLLT